MHTLKNWRVRRAGNGMTVYGERIQDRKEMKITQVTELRPGPNHCIAVRRDDSKHKLLLG